MASRAELTAIIEEAAARHGVPATALLSIAQIESKMNANAANPTSSAAGLFQFVDATAREYGLTGSKRNDAAAQADAAARMMATNARSLERVLGREPDAGELYLAHQQGLGGATALLRNPDKPAVEVLTGVYGSEAKARKALTGNGGNANMTASAFASQWISKGNGTAARIPPASVGSENAVATQLSVRQSPTPATPSPAIVARRNPQNMVPGADLSTQQRNAVTPFLTRDGSGVTDPAGIVLGKQMTTKLAPTPGQSIIERIKPAPVNPSRPAITPASARQAADVRTMRNANQENADAERNRVVVASIPTTAVGGPPTTRRVTSVPVTPRPGQSIIERSPPVRVAQVAPGQSIIERSPPASPLAVAGAPPVARATPAIQSAAMLASRTPGRVAPTPATRTAPAVAPRAVTPVAVATQRSVVPPKATPAPATATMLSAAIAAVRQSGDTSSGSQLEAAQARASGAGGRTRRY